MLHRRTNVRTRIAALLVVVTTVMGRVNAQDTTRTEQRHTTVELTERERAEIWSLSETEWQRYQALLRGIRGSVSHSSLSPIEVLGIHARDSAERRRYAELWAIEMHRDAERILEFQRAYDDAVKRLYPGQRLIDPTRLFGVDAPAVELRRSDRVILHVTLDCPSCDAAMQKAAERLNDVDGIDVFVRSTANEDPDVDAAAIRRWAKAQGIEPGWVKTRRVTLNVDTERDSAAARTTPLLHVRRGGQLKPLAYSAL